MNSPMQLCHLIIEFSSWQKLSFSPKQLIICYVKINEQFLFSDIANLVAAEVTVKRADPRAKTVVIRSPVRISKIEDLGHKLVKQNVYYFKKLSRQLERVYIIYRSCPIEKPCRILIINGPKDNRRGCKCGSYLS